MLDVVCDHCGAILKIPEKYLGQRGKCNYCQGEITVMVGPLRCNAENVEPGERGILTNPGGTIPIGSEHRGIFDGRKVLLVGGLLFILLCNAVALDWFAHAKRESLDGPRQAERSLRDVKEQFGDGASSTVESLAEASRRLEQRGYRYVKEVDTDLGQDIVTYEREANDALFSAEIVRWSGYQPIVSLCFSCCAREEVFWSPDRYVSLCEELGYDACAMVKGRSDYLRCVTASREVIDDGLDRFEARATTDEGWQFWTIQYIAYIKPPEDHNGPVTRHYPLAALIYVTNLEREENVPPSVALQVNKNMEKTREKLKHDVERMKVEDHP